MKTIREEVDALVTRMKGLASFGDDLFIELLDREEALQEKLEEALGELRGKLSFCSLS